MPFSPRRLLASLVLAAACSPGASAAPEQAIDVRLATAVPLAAERCPKAASFAAEIGQRAGGAPIQYRWIRSDLAKGPVETLPSHPLASDARVETTWSLSDSYSGWEAIEILSPVHEISAHADFSLSCPNTPTPRVIPTDPQASSIGATIATKIHTTVPPAGAPCPKTVTFAGTLTVTDFAPGEPHLVTYTWARSDGAIGSATTVELGPNGGAIPVRTSWTLGHAYSGWQTLRVFSPHAYESHHHDFALTCP